LNIAYLCISLLGLLVIGGGFYVSLCRNRERIVCGYPDDPAHPLHKAVRAHGNAVEYAPMIGLLIYILGQHSAPLWILACIVAITLARICAYFGLLLSSSLARPHPLRFLGALATYILGLVLCGYLAFAAMY